MCLIERRFELLYYFDFIRILIYLTALLRYHSTGQNIYTGNRHINRQMRLAIRKLMTRYRGNWHVK